tara:strand:- start:902 stop:1651 length:750 start_codon:yes stop_codon:yes gene_type:complete
MHQVICYIQVYSLIAAFWLTNGCVYKRINYPLSEVKEFTLLKKINGEKDLMAELFLFPNNKYLYNAYDTLGRYVPSSGYYEINERKVNFKAENCYDSLRVDVTPTANSSGLDSVVFILKSKSFLFERVLNIQENDTLTLGVLSYRLGQAEWIKLESNKGPWTIRGLKKNESIEFKYDYKNFSSGMVELKQKTFYSKKFLANQGIFEIEWIPRQFACLEHELRGLLNDRGNLIFITNTSDSLLTGTYFCK